MAETLPKEEGWNPEVPAFYGMGGRNYFLRLVLKNGR